MKKNFVVFCLFLSVLIYFSAGGRQAETVGTAQNVSVYYIDRRLHRLIPTEYTPKSSETENIAREITEAVISKKRNNSEILHLLPKDKKCVTVRVRKNTAFVNLSSAICDTVEKSPENERLIIYQIVNSLTSAEDITSVCFTIDGKRKRDFFGYLDMREIFTPDYYI